MKRVINKLKVTVLFVLVFVGCLTAQENIFDKELDLETCISHALKIIL